MYIRVCSIYFLQDVFIIVCVATAVSVDSVLKTHRLGVIHQNGNSFSFYTSEMITIIHIIIFIATRRIIGPKKKKKKSLSITLCVEMTLCLYRNYSVYILYCFIDRTIIDSVRLRIQSDHRMAYFSDYSFVEINSKHRLMITLHNNIILTSRMLSLYQHSAGKVWIVI